MAAEAVECEQTFVEEYEEAEEAAIEDLLQETEESALEEELDQLTEEEVEEEEKEEEEEEKEEKEDETEEEGDTSSKETSQVDAELPETGDNEESLDDLNDSVEDEYLESESIEIGEEDVFDTFDDIFKDDHLIEEHEQDSIPIVESEEHFDEQTLIDDHTEDDIQYIYEEPDFEELEDQGELIESDELVDLEEEDLQALQEGNFLDFIEKDEAIGFKEVLVEDSREAVDEESQDHIDLDEPLEEEIGEDSVTATVLDELELNMEEAAIFEEPMEDQPSTLVEKDDLHEFKEVSEVEEVEQPDDITELEEGEIPANELTDLEETHTDNIEDSLDVDTEYPTDLDVLGEPKEEFEELPFEDLKEQLEEKDLNTSFEHQQSVTLNKTSNLDGVTTLESEYSQVSSDYQSVFSPQEQFLAQFVSELSLFETLIQAEDKFNEEVGLPLPSPYNVSFNEDLLPPISSDHFDEELSSLEEELAQLNSSRAFQHFHEQLQEFNLSLLTIDTHLTLENLAENLGLVSQGVPLPDPPPYDFLAELESHVADEVDAQLQELKNPLYPYSIQRYRLRPLNRVKAKNISAKATTSRAKSQKPKFKPHDEKHKGSSVEHKPVPLVSSKTSIIPTQKISPAVLEKLRVPSTRGVVKQQIEALNKLKSLDHKMDSTDKFNRIITLTASSRREMGEVLLEKMGDFTYPTDVRKWGKRSLVKLAKEKNWKPMGVFINHGRAEKEVYNPKLDQTGWVVYNKKKGWNYTGNQRIITKFNIDLFKVYYTRLEEQTRTLAADTEQTRVHLSKYDKNSVEYRNRLNFWTQYGYQPPQTAQVYLNQQQEWLVTHVALDGFEILVKTLQTGRFTNHSLKEVSDAWKEAQREVVNSSTITLQQQGVKLSLNHILPEKLVNDLQNSKTDIDCLDENKGATYVFKLQMEKIQNDLQIEIKNVLVEYMNLNRSVVENSRINIDWGIVKDRSKALGMDKHHQEFRYTFAPDIVVEDQHGKIIAVIQLKGRTQDKYAITATISVFQMIELIKYHVEHGVPVALVNIKQDDNGLKYEWLVIGKPNTPPSPILKQLIDPITGLDPILPRNARSRKFAEEIHKEIIVNNGTINLEDKLDDFQRIVNESQSKFQNLRFYKNTPKYLDVSNYWENIVQKFYKRKISEPHKLRFREFYQLWKKIIVNDYEERLKTLEIM